MKTDLIQPRSREAEDELRTIEKTVFSDYKYGFVTNIEADEAPRGLNEEVIRFISARKKGTAMDA
jgi:Fe-S cluster assembly protein SufB